jgi:hypothetical protein
VRTKASVMPLVLHTMEHVITITSATVTIIPIHHTHIKGSFITSNNESVIRQHNYENKFKTWWSKFPLIATNNKYLRQIVVFDVHNWGKYGCIGVWLNVFSVVTFLFFIKFTPSISSFNALLKMSAVTCKQITEDSLDN